MADYILQAMVEKLYRLIFYCNIYNIHRVSIGISDRQSEQKCNQLVARQLEFPGRVFTEQIKTRLRIRPWIRMLIIPLAPF